MTGNSMDACDIVLTEFDGTKITDLCPLTVPFSNDMRDKMDFLRHQINDEKISMADLERLPEFNAIHDEYVKQVADCVNRLVMENHLNIKEIDAIGFHGKTLDHCPPSVARKKNIAPYTLQIGSGQMLADLTGIPVIYDFRSDDLINGGEAAPLAPPHNNNIALCYGLTDAIFYNAGNTSNLSVISGGQAVQGWDAGPFNEFIDKLVRTYTKDVCDLDGKYGKKGQLKTDLLDTLFNNSAITPSGENFYLLPPPRSGDPAFYRYQEIKEFQNPENLNDVIRTAEYFSAYLKDSVYKLLCDRISFYGLEEYRLYEDSIENLVTGTVFVFKGLRDQDPQKIKSLEGADIAWVEEAQTITKKSWDILEPTIRKAGSEIWISMNREEENDPLWMAVANKPDAKTLVRRVNYYDNPFCPEEMIFLADKCKRENIDDYEHIWLGAPIAQGNKKLISSKAVWKAFEPKMDQSSSPLVIGADIARFGDDTTSMCFRKGRYCIKFDVYGKI